MSLDPDNIPATPDSPVDNPFGLPIEVITNVKEQIGQGVPYADIVSSHLPAQANNKMVDLINYLRGEGSITLEEVGVRETRRASAAMPNEELAGIEDLHETKEPTVRLPWYTRLWKRMTNLFK